MSPIRRAKAGHLDANCDCGEEGLRVRKRATISLRGGQTLTATPPSCWSPLAKSVCVSHSRAYGVRTDVPGKLCHDILTTSHYRLCCAKMIQANLQAADWGGSKFLMPHSLRAAARAESITLKSGGKARSGRLRYEYGKVLIYKMSLFFSIRAL